MTGAQNWIFALSALVMMLQVGCEERKSLQPESFDKSGFADPFAPIALKLQRMRRDVASLTEDDCHLFQNRDLPWAKGNITEAWTNSLVAVQNVTQAVTDLKACLSWNLFTVIPCAIHSAVELFYSYRTYKPQLGQLIHDIRSSAGNATTTFIGCAKILITHQSK